MGFFSKSSGLGVDLSNHHIRFIQLDGRGRVLVKKEIVLPEGLVVDEKIADVEKLKKFLEKETKKLPFSGQVVETALLIPDSRVFSTSFFLDSSFKGEAMQSQAKLHAQKEVPVPFENCLVSVVQDEREEQGTRTTVYVAEKEIVEHKSEVFSGEAFSLASLETNSNAVFRVVDKFLEEEHADGLIGIVDIGHSWSTVSLFTQSGEQVFSRTLTHTAKQGSGKKRFVLSQKVVDRIMETINEVVLYFGKQEINVSLVVLSGVEAAQKRVLETCKKKGEKVSIKPIGKVVDIDGLSSADVHTYGACVGAALRAVNPNKFNNNHNFLTRS